MEQKLYENTHDCNRNTKLGKDIQDVGSLLCQLKIADEWMTAPNNIITADVTDTTDKYYKAMELLEKSQFFHVRNTASIRIKGIIYNSNTNLALSWSIVLEKPTSAGTIFNFKTVDLRVVQIDQLNTPIQRVVVVLSFFCFILLLYIAKIEIDRCKRIKIIKGHYRDAMRSISLWGSILMIVLFVIHIVLRSMYFFHVDRRNFDIINKDLVQGLPKIDSFLNIFEIEHIALTIVSSLGWFRMLNYLMLSSRIWVRR